jgi:hypothetical protein
MRKLLAIMIVMLTAASPALARKPTHHHHHHKLRASKPQPVVTSDRGGAQRHPDDIALDRKIGSICRGC